MIRKICLICFVFCLCLGTGGWSVDYVLRHFSGFQRLKAGQWEAFPHSGTPAADPYARAHSAKFETLALGRAEGLVFYLWRDEKGESLRPMCSYQLEGMMPEAGFFTLYAVDTDFKPKKTGEGQNGEISSFNGVRRANGDYLITIAPRAYPGNWLAIDTKGREGQGYYGLALTLYDAPVITTTGFARLDMPFLSRMDEVDCE